MSTSTTPTRATAAARTRALIRWGGLANIGGGVAVAAAYILHPSTVPPEIVGSGFWILVHAIFLVSLVLGIFGLFALLAAGLAREVGGLAIVGTIAAVVSLILIAGLDYSEVFIFPTLAHEFPAVIEKYGAGDSMPSVAFAFPASGVLFMVGYLMLAHDLRRTATVATASAFTLMAGVLIFTVGLSGFVPMLVTQAGAVIFGAGLVAMGRDLWQRHADGAR